MSFKATIDLPNATVASGSFDLVGGFSKTADENGPILASYSVESGAFNGVDMQGMTATPTSRYGAINLHLTFGADGSITSSNFSGSTYSDEFNGTGPGNAITGYLGSDAPGCNSSAATHDCSYAGYFSETVTDPSPVGSSPPSAVSSPVPEPATVALLAAGLLGLAAARWRTA